ncbi:hypothetical protein HG536_0A01500 [Torulaspora globosa]|uniref:RRM domain-containing protein n=1 Tax=Torulaspora globosa TaxID=48254 RepID=A0A7G3Z9Z7_9SACH|nr:uncharacterized protein HG536_0A01500 [Torulaspora globosa]QLL30333.1 hypothetical protein HG536_0A01500 [Torulaspora globosa]
MSDTEMTNSTETPELAEMEETKISTSSEFVTNDEEEQQIEAQSESEVPGSENEVPQEAAEDEQEPSEEQQEPSESVDDGEVAEEDDKEAGDDEDAVDVDNEQAGGDEEAQVSSSHEGEEESADKEYNGAGEAAESSDADPQEDKSTTDVVEMAAEQYGRAENVQYDLLQRQAKYIMESNMLNLPQYQQLSQEDKISALVNMLNSNPDTMMPVIPEMRSLSQPEVVSQPGQEMSPRGRSRPDLNGPMSPEERERYAQYLHGENRITEMHDIPPKSRLFIGNLPLKNVSKEDLFRIFSPYGHILQINIKNAFGFIQYNNPQSVRDAIENESQEQNFGKKLILEVSSSNARPQFDHGDHGTNSSSTFISSSKRPFQHEESDAADMYNDNQGYKKSKRRVPACVIYVKRTADRGYANEVFNHFRRGTDLETDMIFLKPRMELRKMINEVAHDGVWGVILVNKTRNVDIQTFYKGPQGETKFDEYISISADDAIAIFNNLKPSRGSAGGPPVGPVNPYAQQPAAIPPPQHPSSQNYYGGYGMPPPQQPYVQQGYGMPLPNQGYGAPAPAPMGQPYGRYQGSPPAMEPALSQPQLSSLLSANGGGQMNQQQLLSAIQNLPPNVVSNLLSMAQQQQQQQQPQTQQQLLGLLQSMQGQQLPQQQQASAYSSLNDSYAQRSPMGTVQPQQSPPPPLQPQPQQPQQQPQQSSPGNNVQSLLDSLAKLQK